MMWVSAMYSASVLERVMMGCFLGTKHLKLILEGNTTITGFSDADWASQLHCHSISGVHLLCQSQNHLLECQETTSDWQGYTKPAGFPGKGILGKGRVDSSVTRLKPLPGRRVLAGIS